MTDGLVMGVLTVMAVMLLGQSCAYLWHSLHATRRSSAVLLEECVAAAVVGPDPAGRCRQCRALITVDTSVVHVRLYHDQNRPRGPEDDPAFWPRQES